MVKLTGNAQTASVADRTLPDHRRSAHTAAVNAASRPLMQGNSEYSGPYLRLILKRPPILGIVQSELTRQQTQNPTSLQGHRRPYLYVRSLRRKTARTCTIRVAWIGSKMIL